MSKVKVVCVGSPPIVENVKNKDAAMELAQAVKDSNPVNLESIYVDGVLFFRKKQNKCK